MEQETDNKMKIAIRFGGVAQAAQGSKGGSMRRGACCRNCKHFDKDSYADYGMCRFNVCSCSSGGVCEHWEHGDYYEGESVMFKIEKDGAWRFGWYAGGIDGDWHKARDLRDKRVPWVAHEIEHFDTFDPMEA